jgi:hypothetical protein
MRAAAVRALEDGNDSYSPPLNDLLSMFKSGYTQPNGNDLLVLGRAMANPQRWEDLLVGLTADMRSYEYLTLRPNAI